MSDLKILREYLCIQQTVRPTLPQDIKDESEALITKIDCHRPLASNGKHGNLHTSTCGCEDK